jgi:hypothetical protein
MEGPALPRAPRGAAALLVEGLQALPFVDVDADRSLAVPLPF